MGEKGSKWPGLPERLRAAMQRAGYWKGDRPHVTRFSLEHRFLAAYTYKWLSGDAVPDRDNLLRVADALKISPAWLLFGEDATAGATPAGGAGPESPLPAADRAEAPAMKPASLGARLIDRIKAMGYADPDAKFGIAVTRFALDHEYPPGFVYRWIADAAVPAHEHMLRLARDLGTRPAWLHYGEEPMLAATPAPKARSQRPLRTREKKPDR
jgi:hypothetical protein